ncbi:hypothetical protein D3C80_2044120 [compost metagenome]
MKTLASCVQAQALALLGGKAKAHGFFQELHLLADRTGGNAQALGGLGDAAAQADGFENFQCT